MKTMPAPATILLLVFLSLIVGACCGCATRSQGKATANVPLIQKALDATLPATFTGYAKVEHRNQYFDFAIEADGLQRTEAGWQWTWLTYNRTSHFPIFSGLTWSSTGDVTLGKKP